MLRTPAVAGQFYSRLPEELTKEVSQYIIESPKEAVLGAVCPHAGLIYSGHVAGAVYSRIKFPETFILLGPNHTGLGEPVSIMTSGIWELPTGNFVIDEALAEKIHYNASTIISKDIKAHLYEHSLEVQLPFIAYFNKYIKIVPIATMQATTTECKEMGTAISEAIKDSNYKITIIASSDMSHYIPDSEAKSLDKLAIDRILALDPEGLYSTVLSKRISMCGYLPVTTMLFATLGLNATTAELVKYATSGEVSGDYDQVVGYAGIVVK